ncbi:MAG: transketolase [Myxococcales bacterium]|nr:MAG: transketolase [Myxococcales bacterium]
MPLPADKKRLLYNKAREIREKIVWVTEKCGGSHIGGAMSQTDLLVSLYYNRLRINPKDYKWEDRDRFILSKGHGGVGHAVILGDLGFFPEKDLADFNKTGSPFGMHLDYLKVPGVDASTGSLGHGLSIAIGMALGACLQGFQWRTYCLLGDGECNEGTIWEAAMSASHYKIYNMTTIVDRNKFMIDGPTESVMGLEPFAKKWEAFGWRVIEIDGHDLDQIDDAFDAVEAEKTKPTVIIANTIKGKGVDFMEDQAKWHYAGLDSEMSKKAIEAIRKKYPLV